MSFRLRRQKFTYRRCSTDIKEMKSFVLVLKLTLAFPTEAHLPGLCHQRSCLLLGLPLVSSVAPSPRIHTFWCSPLGLFRPAGPPPSTLEPGALSPPPLQTSSTLDPKNWARRPSCPLTQTVPKPLLPNPPAPCVQGLLSVLTSQTHNSAVLGFSTQPPWSFYGDSCVSTLLNTQTALSLILSSPLSLVFLQVTHGVFHDTAI